jgi:hypothetical protein
MLDEEIDPHQIPNRKKCESDPIADKSSSEINSEKVSDELVGLLGLEPRTKAL